VSVPGCLVRHPGRSAAIAGNWIFWLNVPIGLAARGSLATSWIELTLALLVAA
jgi:hypothetical protein